MADLLGALNDRQRSFVNEYVRDYNGTQAAIRAGYSPATAGSIASELLRHPGVSAALVAVKAHRTARVGVTAEQVLQEMSIIANSSLEHYVVTDDGQVRPAPDAPEGVMRAIQSIKKKTRITRNPRTDETTTEHDVELRLWGKPEPLRLMGRHVGLFADRVEHTGPRGGPIQHELAAMGPEELAERARALAAEAAALAGPEEGTK